MSLPVASRDGLPLRLAPEGHSRKSSPTTITHAEMAQLSRDVISPRNRDDSKIFRQQTPKDFRRITPPTSRQPSPKGQPDEIPRMNTDRTDKSDDELGGLEWTDTTGEISAISARMLPSTFFSAEIDEARGSPDSTSTYVHESYFERKGVQYVYYLSTYACFGTIIRIFLERLFGSDCEFRTTNDWLSPLSFQICVTASGMTNQTGGALFVALPANVIGSFIMGVLTVLKPSVWPPIPWLKADHPLQSHDALHVAFKTGMCGSLTTFSSWNSQMVIMLDGSQTVLGPQIASSLCGYLLGTLAAVGSFCFGTHVSAWLNNWRNPIEVSSEQHERNPPLTIHYPRLDRRRSRLCNIFRVMISGRNIGILILVVLMTLFLVGDVVFNSVFYRSLWMAIIFTPPGALLRWLLAVRYNGVAVRPGMDWLPVGTLAVNIIGSCISILLLAFQFRYFKDAGSSWPALILSAIGDGTIGSLTSVSTLVKELFEISARFPNHAKAYYYCGITIGAAMFLSLIVFMPIVRSE
jgi:fluoride ion exporter CrcB/FEX